MPIYEFYCADCHAVFNFLSRTVNTSKRPACPRCGRTGLERQVSRFAISKGRPDSGLPGAESADVDDARMEQVMEELAHDADGLDEDNPQQMARLMRKLHETAGLPLGGPALEAIRRLESGEDPEKIEAEMGDVFDGDESATDEPGGRLRGMVRKLRPPEVDENLYDL